MDLSKLPAMGNHYQELYSRSIADFETQVAHDSGNVSALLGLSELQVYLYIFGLSSRESTIPKAKQAFERLWALDSLSAEAHAMAAIISFLDWNWSEARRHFEKAIHLNPQDPKSRHWFALFLTATTGSLVEAMLQSDTIMSLDPSGDYQVGRGSLLYFGRRNEELRDLMLQTIAQDSTVPWGYDWLGMAYNELGDYENSIETYQKAFTLSDGLVEVGGGLGHTLGLAGKLESAKEMADYYSASASDYYLPQVQRAFIHIGMGEYERAIELLQEAYEAKSWFLIFLKVEPWYDPIRDDPRFRELVRKMEFPNWEPMKME